MQRTGSAVLVFGMAAILAAPARAAEFADVWPGLVTRIERAYVLGDGSEMRTARNALKEALDSELTEEQRSIARYTVAYLNWRLFFLMDGAADDEREALLDEAVELLGADIEDNDANAESHALLSSVYGLQNAPNTPNLSLINISEPTRPY